MVNNSHSNQPVFRRLILLFLHLGKWITGPFFWIIIFAGVVDSTVSAWLISKNFDLKDTPLGWIIQHQSNVIYTVCILLLILCLLWVTCFFLERDTSWLYSQAEKERNKLRQLFAMSLKHEIERISIQEDWKDYQFTELEAEVEAKGRRKTSRFFAKFRSSSDRLRREKSLSEALKKSDEPIILVEGEPGSGKSVALRHVALDMLNQIIEAKNIDRVLPIYVNLKLLLRESNENINRDLIESFIKKTLLRSNDRDIRRFLNQELQNGKLDGTLFFLFDSFDEIPEVLNSTEADEKVNEYGNAIDDFLHWMNKCHGVIASRFYRGPTRLGWTKFRILPLDEDRQLELIRKTELASRAKWAVGQLGNANQTIRSLTSNPFFLSLLCKYLEGNNPFPKNVHVVYETFINQRFAEDENELQRIFQLDFTEVRSVAENIAYCMTASPNLGLNPTRTALQDALITSGWDIGNSFEKTLDALEYMKLARPDTASNTYLSKSFTFSHRRFQEYFATCFALHEPLSGQPRIITPNQLLTQGSWRETAVVLCQTQQLEKLTPMIEEAKRLLANFCSSIPDLISNPEEYLYENKEQKETPKKLSLSRFTWPAGLFHLLSLIQDGCANRLGELSSALKINIDKLVISASANRQRDDKKWALEVAGVASAPTLEYLLEDGFASNSQWLKEAAYKQASHLSNLPPNIAKEIRFALLRLAESGRLQQERHTTEAYLKRLSHSSDFLNGMRLLLFLPVLDLIALLIASLAIILLISEKPSSFINLYSAIIVIAYIFILYILNKGVYAFNPDSMVHIFTAIRWAFNFSSIFLIIPIFIASVIFGLTPSKIVLILIIGYTISYSPLAIGATLLGKFTKVYWWPFIPIWPIIFVLSNPHKISNFNKRIKRNINKLIKLLLVFVLFFSLILLSIILSIHYPSLSNIFIFIILPLFGIPLIIPLCILGIILFCVFIYGTYKDIIYFIWALNFRGPITHNELCKIFEKYHFRGSDYINVIKKVRKQLIGSQETVTFLEKITFEIEKRQIQASRKLRTDLNYFFRRPKFWIKLIKLRKTVKKTRLIRKSFLGYKLLQLNSNDIVLDELCEILNEMRSSINPRY